MPVDAVYWLCGLGSPRSVHRRLWPALFVSGGVLLRKHCNGAIPVSQTQSRAFMHRQRRHSSSKRSRSQHMQRLHSHPSLQSVAPASLVAEPSSVDANLVVWNLAVAYER